MRWTYDKVREFYQRARRRAVCKSCGATGEMEIGPHPGGKMGQPVRVVGADLRALKQWVREAGWTCRKCRPHRLRVVPAKMAAQPVVSRKPWEPYPEQWWKWNVALALDLKKMETRTLEPRTPAECERYKKQYEAKMRERHGWMTEDEWAKCHEPVPEDVEV